MSAVDGSEKVGGPEVESDPPIVAELKRIDDQYLELEKACEKEVQTLIRQYTERQKPLLEQRARVLKGDGAEEDPKTGTPALNGFWCQALANHPAFEDKIEEWDRPVLDYLMDITTVDLDPENSYKGFRLQLRFAANPYFTNAVLSKEYHTTGLNSYTGENDVTEINGCTIDWKPGMDVTVEVKKKKKTGGGAKKASQKKEAKEPRSSFFRCFFLSCRKEGGRLPEGIDAEMLAMQCMEDEDDEPEEEALLELFMENDHEVGMALRETIIPFAVRWYTGEARGEEREEDDDDEGDEDDEDDDDESSDEDEPPAKGKKGQSTRGKTAKAPKSAEAQAQGEQKQEECKQQ